jgi:hypothetical protein
MSFTTPQPQQPAPYYYPQAPARRTNGLSIASMVLGILWITWIGSILAVIFGHVALGQIRRDGSDGKGMAITGLVLGYVGVATLTGWILLLIVAAGQPGAGG